MNVEDLLRQGFGSITLTPELATLDRALKYAERPRRASWHLRLTARGALLLAAATTTAVLGTSLAAAIVHALTTPRDHSTSTSAPYTDLSGIAPPLPSG